MLICGLPSLASAAPAKLFVDTKTREVSTEDGNPIIYFKSVTLRLDNVTFVDSTGIRVLDFGSTNGTRINGKIGFNHAPIATPTGNVFTALVNLGLVTTPSLTTANVTGLDAALALKALDSAVVHKTGSETVAGIKTFSSAPVVPTAAFPESAIASLVSDLAAINVSIGTKVSLTGAETIAGIKTFSSAPVVPTAAFPEAAVASLVSDLAAINVSLGLKALDTAVVHNTGAETIAGIKTFSIAPVVPTAAFPESAIAGLVSDLAAINVSLGLKALDSAVVHNTGAETIAGVKTYSSAPVVPSASFPESAIASLVSDLAAKAVDTAVVHNTGTETVAGAKTFTSPATFTSEHSGTITMDSLSAPGAPTVGHTGVAGASTWTYKIVAKLGDGTGSVASLGGSTTSGNATLDTNNYNNLTWSAVTGAISYDVYRTAVGLSPSSTGKITNVAGLSYDDHGAAGDSAPAPTSNSTGNILWAGDGVADIGGASGNRPRNGNFTGNVSSATSATSGNSTVGGSETVTGPITGPISDNGGAVVDVTAKGAVGDNSALNYVAFQAAADAIPANGGTLLVPDGTFKLERTVLVKAGTRILGTGAGSRVVPTIVGSFTPISDASVGGTIYTLFANTNFAAGGITDTNITFENLALGPVNSTAWNGFAIFVRQAQNVTIRNCTAQYLANFTAVLASKDILIEGCTGNQHPNAAFDFWEGTVGATVRDCTVYDVGIGVQFNAKATTGTASLASANLTVDNCRIWRSLTGVYASPLNAVNGSTVRNVKVTHCYFNQASAAAHGVTFHAVTLGEISHNVFDSMNDTIVSTTAESSVACAQISIGNNEINNCTLGTGTFIAAYGTRMSVEHNKAVSSTATGGTGIVVSDPNSIVDFNDMTGATFYLSNVDEGGSPTSPALLFDSDTANHRFYFAGDLVGSGGNLNVTGTGTFSGNVTAPNLTPSYIATQSLAAPGTFLFNSIPGTYHQLEITVSGRGTTSATNVAVVMTFNNDSGSNYEWIEFSGTTQTAQTSGRIGVSSAATSAANQGGSFTVTVPAYAATTLYKNFMSLNVYSPTAGTLTPLNEFGVWKNTSAITRVDIATASGGFATGSTATLIAR